ncbi:hypothetical protein FRC11_013452 [Ceratobasidium sp. 423]|nr:hypothetical protein FRC11_013452 [Ceratobasidium sp. 423]
MSTTPSTLPHIDVPNMDKLHLSNIITRPASCESTPETPEPLAMIPEATFDSNFPEPTSSHAGDNEPLESPSTLTNGPSNQPLPGKLELLYEHLENSDLTGAVAAAVSTLGTYLAIASKTGCLVFFDVKAARHVGCMTFSKDTCVMAIHWMSDNQVFLGTVFGEVYLVRVVTDWTCGVDTGIADINLLIHERKCPIIDMSYDVQSGFFAFAYDDEVYMFHLQLERCPIKRQLVPHISSLVDERVWLIKFVLILSDKDKVVMVGTEKGFILFLKLMSLVAAAHLIRQIIASEAGIYLVVVGPGLKHIIMGYARSQAAINDFVALQKRMKLLPSGRSTRHTHEVELPKQGSIKTSVIAIVKVLGWPPPVLI